jgi:outer membrane lipoprotein-sorting protein
MTVTTTIQKVQVNKKLADNLFTFTTPAGVREVEFAP